MDRTVTISEERYRELLRIEDSYLKGNGMSYGERELAQLIRRRMMTQEVKDKKKYTRKFKHKKAWDI